MNPLVSIITVCFNSEQTIAQTLQSVLEQTYRPFEYILIDGASSDNTLNLIKEYEKAFAERHILYRFVSESDNGIFHAMNKGVALANGEWIGIINSDDYYEHDTLNVISEQFDVSSDVELIHGNIRIVESNRELRIEKPNSDLSLLKNSMSIYHPAVFVKKRVYQQYGFFDLKYRLSADWDLMLKFYVNGVKFLYIDKVLANFRNEGAGSGFTVIHLKERYHIRHSYINSKAVYQDLKDILIFIYFNFFKRATSSLKK